MCCNNGKTDIIYGQGHSYGIYWLEQRGDGDNRHWVKHTIDESFSQVHALKMVDIDGDGQMELLAGKRYRGHSGHDPGSYDPLVVYYYKIDRKTGQFTRYPISVNGTAAAGTQFITMDLDGDGDLDIATAGKSGVHFFENKKIDLVPKAQREKEILLDTNWPFPGEGPVGAAGRRTEKVSSEEGTVNRGQTSAGFPSTRSITAGRKEQSSTQDCLLKARS